MGDAIRLSNQVYTNQTIIVTSTTFVISKSNHKIQYITGKSTHGGDEFPTCQKIKIIIANSYDLYQNENA